MNPLVQDYLNTHSSFPNKNQVLISLGLFEKEYSKKNVYSTEYPNSEYDSNTGSYRYYKKVPVEVTDEEYEEILKCRNASATPAAENNTVAVIFKVFAWILFVGGFISGIVVGNSVGWHFSFGTALLVWVASFVAGMLYYGFAEIIQLLTDIRNQ